MKNWGGRLYPHGFVIAWIVASAFYAYGTSQQVYPVSPGDPGDVLGTLFWLWWPVHALKTGLSIFHCPLLEYPYGTQVFYYHPLDYLATIPLTSAFGPGFTYNFLIAISFGLTFLAAERLFSLWVVSRFARVVAASMMAVGPYHFHLVHIGLDLSQTQWPLLALYGFLRSYRERRSGPFWGGALAYLLTLLSSPYFFIILSTLLVFLGLPEVWRRRAEAGDLLKSLLRQKIWIGGLGVAAIAWTWYFTSKILPLFATIRYDWNEYGFLNTFRARYWFLPPGEHPFLGAITRTLTPQTAWLDRGEFLGYAFLILVGFWLVKQRHHYPSPVKTTLWTAVLFWSLSVMPVFWVEAGPLKTKMYSPFFLYHYLVPFFHAPSRFFIVVFGCFSLWTALALQDLRARRPLLALLAVVWAFGVDYSAAWRLTRQEIPEGSGVLQALKGIPGPKAVLEMPLMDLSNYERYRLLLDLTRHETPLLNTERVVRYPGESRKPFHKLAGAYKGFWLVPEPSLRALARAGATHLLFRKDWYGSYWPDLEARLARIPGVRKIASDSRYLLCSFRATPGIELAFDQEDQGGDTFEPPEFWTSVGLGKVGELRMARDPADGAWVGYLSNRGGMILRNPGKTPRRVKLSMRLLSLAPENRMRMAWKDLKTGEHEVIVPLRENRWSSFEIVRLLPPGSSEMIYEPLDPVVGDASFLYGYPPGTLSRSVAVRDLVITELP